MSSLACKFTLAWISACALAAADFKAPALTWRTNEVVAFIGGANMVAAQESGHFETLLTLAFPDHHLRFRSLAWEADTVFAQPRDLNFPPLTDLLDRVGATTVFVEFGQAESFRGGEQVGSFKKAYAEFIKRISAPGRRVVLITPAPFENGRGLVPDLSARNEELALYVQAIRSLAAETELSLIDLFADFGEGGSEEYRLTENGLHRTPFGHGLAAYVMARQIGIEHLPGSAAHVNPQGEWSDPQLERLRQAIRHKNALWARYWRPMNWAFLAGDRTEQLSSRDHRDPSIRWFPKELEQFIPLIKEAEARIEAMARAAHSL